MGTDAVAFFFRRIFRARFALRKRERKKKGEENRGGRYNGATRRDPSAVNGRMPSEPHDPGMLPRNY